MRLAALRAADGLKLRLYYDPSRYDVDSMRRVVARLDVLLESALDTPGNPITNLEILSESERSQLATWNQTSVTLPACQNLVSSFETQVERSPDAVAVAFEEGQLSFDELDQRANQLAHHLRRHGVGRESRVAMLLERSVDQIVAIFAILKAGGAWVPLDPLQPKERLASALRDAEAGVVLCHESTRASLPEGGHHVVLDSQWRHIATSSGEKPALGFDPANLAYVIYTSG
ncbi:MAG: AMP-binding protein [Thermoanaerobaculia bacterium]|nr:AMP-binding protein [Thermoanaerobaculia bacterium]